MKQASIVIANKIEISFQYDIWKQTNKKDYQNIRWFVSSEVWIKIINDINLTTFRI